MIDVIAFDADDTLWHTECLYVSVQHRYRQLLAKYPVTADVDAALYQTEMRNLPSYGYGIKAFALSMIETAIQLTGGQIQAGDIQIIIDLIREMLTAEVRLIEHAAETIALLSRSHTLMLITKGDLIDQEAKVARSGLAEYFTYVEIVSDKNLAVYQALLSRHNILPARFLMVGNSLRSDILPIIALGGQAVYIPYHLTWAHENDVDPVLANRGYHQIEHLGQLPILVERLSHAV
jgi:putative hydrolase of the HAD superfamily